MTLTHCVTVGEPKGPRVAIDLEAGTPSSPPPLSMNRSIPSSFTTAPVPAKEILPTFIFVRDFDGRSVVVSIDDHTTIDAICIEALRKSGQSIVAPYPPEQPPDTTPSSSSTSSSSSSSSSSSPPPPPTNTENNTLVSYGGQILHGSKTLKEYNIQPGATLELSTRLKGGIDGMTIMAFAILGAIALYLVYRLVMLLIKLGKWLWRFFLRAPTMWVQKNCCTPVCQILRFFLYNCKETCCALCDCCDLHYHPWKRMDITS